MAIYTKQTLIESFPAYDVYAREADPLHGAVNIIAGESLGLASVRGFYREYKAGSAASYALAYNECPIAAYEDAKAKGHETHWINACGSLLTSHERAKDSFVRVTIGMRVCFEGRQFTIEAAPNNNLRLAPVVG